MVTFLHWTLSTAYSWKRMFVYVSFHSSLFLSCSWQYAITGSGSGRAFHSSPPSAAYMRLWIGSALVQIMACRLFGAKSLSEPLLLIRSLGTNFSENLIKIQNFSFTKMHWKVSSVKRWPFCPGGDELTVDKVLHESMITQSIDTYTSPSHRLTPRAPFTNIV